MANSFLSPIVSGESSPSSTSGAGQDYETAANTLDGGAQNECRRALIAIECSRQQQCRTPSTSSQVSELDDELITTSHHETRTNSNNNNIKPTSGSGSGGQAARASSFSSTASGGSIAQQFLLHDHHRSSLSSLSDNNNNMASTLNNQHHHHPNPHHHHHHHQYISKLYNLKQTKRFRQILQSIPLPLVATSIITVFILCLLLSECKSLQLGSGSSVQSFVMDQEAPSADNLAHQAARLVSLDRSGDSNLDSSPPSGDGDGGDGSFRSIKLLRRHQHQHQHHHSPSPRAPAASEPAAPGAGGLDGPEAEVVQHQPAVEGAGDELEQQPVAAAAAAAAAVVGLEQRQPSQASQPLADFNQIELKRQILRQLVQGSHRHLQTTKRHSTEEGGGHHHHLQQQQQQPSDSLGSILMLSNGGSGELDSLSPGELEQQQQQTDSNRFFSEAKAGDENAAVDSLLRPAHLRSSSLELDGQGQEADRKQLISEQQQPDQQASNYRHRYPSHLQQQQHQHNNNNQNNYKLTQGNEQEHVKNHHHQHPLGGGGGNNNNNNNNHDRPFDVYQIQCNNTEEGFERFACPTADNLGRFRCIEDSLFCDGYYDCPGGEDENRVSCMYYKLKQNRQQGSGGHRPTLMAD